MNASAQTRLLARTFFTRLFESELMPPGLPQVQLLVGVVAFLAAPALLMPIFLIKKYMWIRSPVLLHATMAQDRTLALIFCMLATALVTLAIWENIFPDRRDSRHLAVLPIPMRSFVVARLAALGALFAIVCLATMALLSLSFGLMVSLFGGGFFPAIVLRQFVVFAGAEGFVFFGIIALQCLVLSAAGPATARQVTLLIQIALTVAAMQIFVALPPSEAFVPDATGTPPWVESPLASIMPPLWFIALYECMAGTCGAMRPLALLAAVLGTATPVMAVLLYALSYRRLTRLAVEGRTVSRRPAESWMSRAFTWLATRVAVSPISIAVCLFTIRTLGRSRQHRMLLAAWIGLALALIVPSMLSLLSRGAVPQPHPAVLVAPLIISALTLAGMRMLIALPVEIKANWTVKLREPVRLTDALHGVASAFAILGVLPAAVVAAVSAGFLWGPLLGLQHALFCALVGLITVEVLMRGVDKIPFTCTYCPGKARIGKLWPAYLTAFSFFTYVAAVAEASLLRYPRAYGIAAAMLGLTLATLVWLRHRDTTRLVSLRFEEEPLDALTVMSLQ